MDAQQVTPAGAVSDHSDASDDGAVAVKQQRKQQYRRRNVIRDTDESDSDMPARQPTKRRPKYTHKSQDSLVAKRIRKPAIRVPWTDEELNLLRKFFPNFLRSGSLPGFALITTAQKRYPVLLKRTPAQIKSRFYQLQKCNNKLSPVKKL